MLIAVNTTLGHTDRGTGTPLLFLHAFPLHAEMWTPQLTVLSALARVLTVDAPGRGRSASMSPVPSLDERAVRICALLDLLKIPKVVLVGLSMGGYNAFAFYRRFPERVLALVLADTRAQADTPEARAGRTAMIRTAETQGHGPIADAMLPKLLGKTAHETRPELVQQVRAMIHSVPIPAIVSDLQAMAARPDSTDLLPTIRVPTLIIVGDEDVPSPPADAREMADRLPQPQLAVLTHAGHLSNLEQPEAFNQAMKDFLGTLKGRT